jgi:ATP-dependent RNA helicase DDX31/DBP7
MNKPQVIFCSATATLDLKSIAGYELNQPKLLQIQEESAVPNQLKQYYAIVPAKLRLVTLCAQLMSIHSKRDSKSGLRTIVYFSNCDSVDFHYNLLSKTSITIGQDTTTTSDSKPTIGTPLDALFCLPRPTKVYKLHGNIDHTLRIQTYETFTRTKTHDSILLCTDVAARGLDWPGVGSIIQFDPPCDRKDYIHRMGRTARLGMQGEGTLFLQPSEIMYLERLKNDGVIGFERKVLHILEQGLFTDDERKANKALKSKSEVKYEHRVREEATRWQHAFEQCVQRSPSMAEEARKAFLASVRAYATHASDEKDVFHVRQLHLGHYAKAFAMRDAPSKIRVGSEKLKVKMKRGVEAAFSLSKGVESYASARYATKLANEFNIGAPPMMLEHIVRPLKRKRKQ